MLLAPYTFLQPTFWSYSIADLDTEIHKTLIIKQILNQGDAKALFWLRATYAHTAIEAVIKESMVSEWSKKSLSLWTKIYNVSPTREKRFT